MRSTAPTLRAMRASRPLASTIRRPKIVSLVAFSDRTSTPAARSPVEHDPRGLAPFAKLGSARSGMAEEELVEVVPRHLERMIRFRVKSLGERVADSASLVGSVPTKRAPRFHEEAGAHVLEHAYGLEDRDARGKERFAEMKPRMPSALEDQHPAAAEREARGAD